MICETMAGDNRFEIIAKAKHAILEGTNIDTSEDEMKVLDNFLFRCWQMGWLDKYDDTKTGKWVLDPNGMDWNISAWRCSECGFVATHIGVEPNGLGDSPLNWAGSKFCPQCGVRITGYER